MGKLLQCPIVQPEGKFGALEFNKENLVKDFKEKPKGDGLMD